MEWEFAEDAAGGGSFVATGKVVNFLRTHLARGEMDEALALYESCAQDVGDQLTAEFVTSSTKLQKAMANLFFRARDYKRAATACEKLGEWAAAARSYEASFAYEQAASCYVRANQHDKAAAVFRKAGNCQEAARLYRNSGNLQGAAEATAKDGDPLGAARLLITSLLPFSKA